MMTTDEGNVEIADFIEISTKSTLTGKIDLGEGSNDTVRIHSGSKVTGAFEGVENVELVLDDSDFKNTALWQNFDGSEKVDLSIDLAYGMTGTFALCSRKSASTDWSELDNDGKIQLNIDGVEFKNLDINNGVAADDFYQYKIVKKGNTISLAVTTI